MEHSSAVVKVFLLLRFSVHLSSAVTHTLQVFYTGVTPGINFPEFIALSQVDGQQFNYYDSNIRKMIPKTEWIKRIDADYPDYLDRNTEVLWDAEETFKVDVATAMQRFNQSKGVHTFQQMCGCELDDDGTTRGYSQFGYDGEDFVSFDLRTLTWVAPKPQALITKNKLDNDPGNNHYWKFYLEKECIEWLYRHLSYSKETLEMNVRPTASVFQKHSSSPEVVCHATGFFPRTVNITWQKDGEDVHKDVDLRETLPNQDGSFQKRSILTVSAEDLQKHTYTCMIQHSSLKKEIVLHEEDIRILNPDGGSGGAPIGIIVAVVVALVVIVGIVVRKKNNSGFSSVPPTSTTSTEGDSSSEYS